MSSEDEDNSDNSGDDIDGDEQQQSRGRFGSRSNGDDSFPVGLVAGIAGGVVGLLAILCCVLWLRRRDGSSDGVAALADSSNSADANDSGDSALQEFTLTRAAQPTRNEFGDEISDGSPAATDETSSSEQASSSSSSSHDAARKSKKKHRKHQSKKNKHRRKHHEPKPDYQRSKYSMGLVGVSSRTAISSNNDGSDNDAPVDVASAGYAANFSTFGGADDSSASGDHYGTMNDI